MIPTLPEMEKRRKVIYYMTCGLLARHRAALQIQGELCPAWDAPRTARPSPTPGPLPRLQPFCQDPITQHVDHSMGLSPLTGDTLSFNIYCSVEYESYKWNNVPTKWVEETKGARLIRLCVQHSVIPAHLGMWVHTVLLSTHTNTACVHTSAPFKEDYQEKYQYNEEVWAS